MKTNFSDQISYRFPRFISKHSYISLRYFLYFHTFKTQIVLLIFYLNKFKEYLFKNNFSPLWSICRVHSMRRTIADRKRLGKWAFFKLSSFNSNFLWRQPRCRLDKQIRLCSKINWRVFNPRLFKFLLAPRRTVVCLCDVNFEQTFQIRGSNINM